MATETLFGYYSREHEEYNLSRIPPIPAALFYITPDGRRVRVTCVGRTEDPMGIGYMWPDAVSVGEVSHYAFPQIDALAAWRAITEGGVSNER